LRPTFLCYPLQTFLTVAAAAALAACSVSIQEPAQNAIVTLPSPASTTKVVVTGNATYTGLKVTVDGVDFSNQMVSKASDRDEGDLSLLAGIHTLGASAEVYCWYCTGSKTQSTDTHTFLVVPPEGGLPSCARFNPIGISPPEVLSSNDLLKALFSVKLANPTKQTIVVGFSTPSQKDVWGITIEESVQPSLQSNEALVVLSNQVGSGWEKEMLTVNGNNCLMTGQLAHVAGGAVSNEIKITTADTTTLVFSKPVAFTPITVRWVDVAVWSEPAFWAAFGGKRITFKWTRD